MLMGSVCPSSIHLTSQTRRTPQRTSIRRKSALPSWEDEEFRFEVADDAQLQNEPVEFKVCGLFVCAQTLFGFVFKKY